MYVILGSGERQSWAMEEEELEEEELESRGIQNSSNSHPKFNAVSSDIVISKGGERSPLLGNRINSESLTK